MTNSPYLSAAEQETLITELEALGFVSRDAHGKRQLTKRGHVVSLALTGIAMLGPTEAEQEARPPQ
jgi:hypothetical protein